MNEGYQDREDPGPDRPLPARRPARRGAPRLDDDAVDADLERRGGRRAGPALRPGPPGRRTVLARQGDAQDGARRARSRSSRSGPARDLVGWRYAGPFDDLPAVRAAFADGHPRRPGRAVRAPGRRLGRGRRGRGDRASSTSRPGCGAEDFQLGKALGLPVIAPLDESGHRPRRVRVADRAATSATSPTRSSSTSSARAASTASRRITHRYPHCWRCGTPLVFRLVDEWYICMGPVYDQPRETLTAGAGRRQPALPDHGGRRPDPLDPGLRLRARARLAAATCTTG